MGWLSDNWRKRRIINFNNSGAGASGTVDVEFVVPAEWDEFWDNIDINGFDIRITQADGVTLVPYDFASFNSTTRTGTIQVDGAYATGFANEVVVLFMYYDPVTGNSDGTSAVTISSAETGYMDFTDPRSLSAVYTFEPERPGISEPLYQTAGPTNVRNFVVIDITRSLERRQTPSGDRLNYEEPFSVIATSTNDAGSGASVHSLDYMGFFEAQTPRGRRTFLRTTVESMVNGTNYTIIPNIVTLIPGAPVNPGYRGIEPRYGIWGQNTQVTAP